MNRQALAREVKAFLSENKGTSIAFGVKAVEDNNHRLTHLPFEGLTDIAIPVSAEDLVRLRGTSTQTPEGSYESDLHQPGLLPKGSIQERFFIRTLPTMIQVAVKQMQPDLGNSGQPTGLVVQAKKLILTDSGSGVSIQPNSNPGVLATIIVTFPVISGYEGGNFLVQPHADSNLPVQTFNCSAGSDSHLYYTFYRASCSLGSAPVSSGSRLAAVFDLSYPPGSAHLSRPSLADLMRSWPEDFGRLLAFPLFQRCTNRTDKLSFAGLRGDDQRLAALLTSLGCLQLHLAVLVTHRRGQAAPTSAGNGCECCRKRGCPCLSTPQNQDKMSRVDLVEISTTKWVDPAGESVRFAGLNVDPKTEMVGEGVAHPADDEVLDGSGTVLDQWFYRAILVAWPKERSARMDCLYRFAFVLEDFERRLNQNVEPKESILRSLKSLLDQYFRETSQHSLDRFRRLMDLCVKLGAAEETARLLATLQPGADGKGGIDGPDMAELIARAIRLAGWPACAAPTAKLIVQTAQMPHYAGLAQSLLASGCAESASGLVGHMASLLFRFGPLSVTSTALVQCALLIAKTRLDLMPTLVDQMKSRVDYPSLSAFLLGVRPASEGDPWFRDLCIHFAGLAVPKPLTSHQLLSSLTLSASPTACQTALRIFTEKNGPVLVKLLSQDGMWDLASQGEAGRRALAYVVDGRIQELTQKVADAGPTGLLEPDGLIWEYPDACVPRHPLVQSFLRSDQQKMVYANFNGIGHARNWARKHFWYGANGHLAKIEMGGTGSRAYCIIEKIPRKAINPARQAGQELFALITRRISVLGDAECSVTVSDDKTIRSLVVNKPGEGGNPGPVQQATPSTSSASNLDRIIHDVGAGILGPYKLAQISPAAKVVQQDIRTVMKSTTPVGSSPNPTTATIGTAVKPTATVGAAVKPSTPMTIVGTAKKPTVTTVGAAVKPTMATTPSQPGVLLPSGLRVVNVADMTSAQLGRLILPNTKATPTNQQVMKTVNTKVVTTAQENKAKVVTLSGGNLAATPTGATTGNKPVRGGGLRMPVKRALLNLPVNTPDASVTPDAKRVKMD